MPLLSKLTLVAGSAPGQPPLEIQLSNVTVFVGPNNSGKTRALAELERCLTNANPQPGLVVQGLELIPWTVQQLESELKDLVVEIPPEGQTIADHVQMGRVKHFQPENTAQVVWAHMPSLTKEAQQPNNLPRPQFAQLLSLLTERLDGKNRLQLVEEQAAGDIQAKNASNLLGKLFKENDARLKLRQIVHEAFSKYLVVDPTNIGKLRIRLSSRPPQDESEEKNWDKRAVDFHAAATLISNASDGVKAFVGMLMTVIAGAPKLTLIDEPEAFLHPSLCTRLGKEITSALTSTDHRLFVATHSASFLMGCVQGGVPINIVRLTNDVNGSTARLLAKDKLTPLMRNPLLRSIGVLSALFYNAVIVTEADADRAFYQEINERLLTAKDPRGIPVSPRPSHVFLVARRHLTAMRAPESIAGQGRRVEGTARPRNLSATVTTACSSCIEVLPDQLRPCPSPCWWRKSLAQSKHRTPPSDRASRRHHVAVGTVAWIRSIRCSSGACASR